MKHSHGDVTLKQCWYATREAGPMEVMMFLRGSIRSRDCDCECGLSSFLFVFVSACAFFFLGVKVVEERGRVARQK